MEATYEDRGAGAVLRGRREIEAHAARVHAGFGDLEFELLRVAHGDDFTAGEWRSRRRVARPNGRRTTPGSG